jgi:hypothetical protein
MPGEKVFRYQLDSLTQEKYHEKLPSFAELLLSISVQQNK